MLASHIMQHFCEPLLAAAGCGCQRGQEYGQKILDCVVWYMQPCPKEYRSWQELETKDKAERS